MLNSSGLANRLKIMHCSTIFFYKCAFTHEFMFMFLSSGGARFPPTRNLITEWLFPLKIPKFCSEAKKIQNHLSSDMKANVLRLWGFSPPSPHPLHHHCHFYLFSLTLIKLLILLPVYKILVTWFFTSLSTALARESFTLHTVLGYHNYASHVCVVNGKN